MFIMSPDKDSVMHTFGALWREGELLCTCTLRSIPIPINIYTHCYNGLIGGCIVYQIGWVVITTAGF